MTHNEIYDFFKSKGAIRSFNITDSPIDTIYNLNEKTLQIESKNIIVSYIKLPNIQYFIDVFLNNKYSDFYIYSNQDFCDNMEYIRFYEDIPDISTQRYNKINQLIKKINDNII